jgi:hypothetical protein
MGNQLKKDAKRAKRKKLQKRESQIRTEQENIAWKQRMKDYSGESLTDMVKALVKDGLVSDESKLYQVLKGDETFLEMQRRILTQAQLQANDPRANHRVRTIPPRLYICKSAASVATLHLSPAVLTRAGESLVSCIQAFYDLYADGDGAIKFACYVFGHAGNPCAQHIAILAGADKQLEIFIISEGKWMRIGSGEHALQFMDSISQLIIHRSNEYPQEDPFDDILCAMTSKEVENEDDEKEWLEAYEKIASGQISAVEPIGGELLSRVEDWVTQQQHTIERLHDTVDDLSGDLESSRKRERELDKEVRRTAAELATAKATLASKIAKAAPQQAALARPLKDRMAEIFLG